MRSRRALALALAASTACATVPAPPEVWVDAVWPSDPQPARTDTLFAEGR